MISPAIIAGRTGFTPDPTAMNVDIGAIPTGRKAIVMAEVWARVAIMDDTGKKAIAMGDTGRGATVMAGIGTSIEIIAITPGAMHRIPGITTGTRRATA